MKKNVSMRREGRSLLRRGAALCLSLMMCTSFVFAGEGDNEAVDLEIASVQQSAEETIAGIDEESSFGSLDNFTLKNVVMNYKDVADNAWFFDSIRQAVSYGLMRGMSDETFNPDGNLTVAECITLAARLHSIYTSGSESFEQGNPWYRVYVDYALDNGIIDEEFEDYDAKITRGEFAIMMDNSMWESLTEINKIEDESIPDMNESDDSYEAMYDLYRAGILTGMDDLGTAAANTELKRSEAAAILLRMANSEARKSLTLSKPDVSIAAAKKVRRYNVSYSPVTNNGDKSLPKGVDTVKLNETAYFNVHISSDLKAKSFELYVKEPDARNGNFYRLHTEKANSFIRYANYRYRFSKTGKYLYYWIITYTNGSRERLSTGYVNVIQANNSNGAQQVYNVAKKYIGTKYPYWKNKGFHYRAWCADFVSYCAKEAGQSKAIPSDSSVAGLRTKIRNAGGKEYSKSAIQKGQYTPGRGDIIIFKSNGASHVGIVDYARNNVIYYIDGNNTSKGNGNNACVAYSSCRYNNSGFTCVLKPNYR